MGVVASMHFLGIPLILFGIALGIAGCFWLAAAPSPASASAEPTPASVPFHQQPHLWALLIIAAAGLALRVFALDAKGLSHPEIYIPGLDLPAGMSEPPPRHGFFETLSWHFHSEAHPFGYYMSMWVWTKLFGTGVTTIRLPHALLGAGSVLLIYRVAALTYGRRVGLIAAALLAVHGFHIFWSQYAKMYISGAFFGLLSTWLLLELAKDSRRRPWLEAAYVASLVCTAFTVEFAWALLGVHMLWAALKQVGERGSVLRLTVLQTAAALLASPILAHAAMTGRNNAVDPPTLEFLVNYFSFGFLFQNGDFTDFQPQGLTVGGWHVGALSPAAAIVVLIVSLVLLGLGVTRAPAEPVLETPAPRNWPRRLGLIAAAAFAVMVGFIALATRRVRTMCGVSLLPWLMLLVPLVSARVRPQLRRFAPWLDRLLGQRPWLVNLIMLLAIPPVLGLFLISFKLRLTAPRAFIIFVPYLLILIAAGVERLAHRRVVFALTGAALAVTFTWSAVLAYQTPTSPRDYRGLAAKITARLQPGDLIFVRQNEWAYTPILYYLRQDRLVAQRYGEALKASPHARVWVLSFADDKATPDMFAPVAGYQLADREEAMNATAWLYAPGR